MRLRQGGELFSEEFFMPRCRATFDEKVPPLCACGREWSHFQRSHTCRRATPPSMKIPLRRRGVGVSSPSGRDPPRRLKPSAPPRRGFSEECALALLVFLVPATFVSHSFWLAAGTPRSRGQLINSSKNVAIWGGLIFIAGTQSQLSLWQRRRGPSQESARP
jgi:hypothetical protein